MNNFKQAFENAKLEDKMVGGTNAERLEYMDVEPTEFQEFILTCITSRCTSFIPMLAGNKKLTNGVADCMLDAFIVGRQMGLMEMIEE